MAKKESYRIDFGTLPRDGYVYGLYRTHIIRLGLVVAGLVLILCWAWRGSMVTVRSNVCPPILKNVGALAALEPETVEIPDEETRIRYAYTVAHDGSYRYQVTFDTVEPLGDGMYLATIDGIAFFALANERPLAGTSYRVVLTHPTAEQRSVIDTHDASGCVLDLRQIPVGTEQADTVQMLIFTPVVIVLVVFWLLMLQDPRRHPIYRQLGRYRMRIDSIVASIDQDFANGNILSESRKLVITPNWRLQRSAFTTTIFKNTAPAADAAGEEEIIPHE